MTSNGAKKYGNPGSINSIITTNSNFPAYIKKATRFLHLIDGQEIFSSMEIYVLRAKSVVMMSFWVLDLQTPLLNSNVIKELTRNGYQTMNWLSLIDYKVKKGVWFYILINNHDPILSYGYHTGVWSTYYLLYELWKKLPKEATVYLQFICSADKPYYTSILQQMLDAKVEVVVKAWNENLESFKEEVIEEFKNAPGLWLYINYNSAKKKFEKKKSNSYGVLFSSTHHKQIIVDEHTLICGGVDIARNRIDNRDHQKKFRNKYKNQYVPWHDVSCLIEGPVVQDASRNFVSYWNRFISYFQQDIKWLNHNQSDKKMQIQIPPSLKEMIFPLTSSKNAPYFFSPAISSRPILLARLERTVTERAKNWLPLQTLPYLTVNDTYKAIKKAIEAAEQFIYIENQFLRSKEITQMILDRYALNPHLKVLIVLPFLPEELLNLKSTDDLSRHGVFLQEENLEKLAIKMKSNLGLYNLWDFKQKAMIFLHSKIMIVDDAYCYIGSANFNGRSLFIDSEIGVSIFSKMHIKTFRYNLWKEHLGMRSSASSAKYVSMIRWKPLQFVTEWNKIANSNEQIKKLQLRKSNQGNVISIDINKKIGKEFKGIQNKTAQDILNKIVENMPESFYHLNEDAVVKT